MPQFSPPILAASTPSSTPAQSSSLVFSIKGSFTPPPLTAPPEPPSRHRLHSVSSDTSSTYTLASVVHNPAVAGLAKLAVRKSVVDYVASTPPTSASIDPSTIYLERLADFYTALNRSYNVDVDPTSLMVPEGKIVVLSDDEEFPTSSGHYVDRVNNSYIENPISDSTPITYPNSNQSEDQSGSQIDINSEADSTQLETRSHEQSDPHSNAPLDSLSEESLYSLDDTYESSSEDDESNLELMPSPPRLPPRFLDPTKLYGMYDFSGPESLHCTLARDEPVELLNDLDDYWWLIRKMQYTDRILYYQGCLDEEMTRPQDAEDGKVGFVPAECLETHGERLARLNCFKNEGLLKDEREQNTEIESARNYLEDLVVSINKAKDSKKIKVVTFEDLSIEATGALEDSSHNSDQGSTGQPLSEVAKGSRELHDSDIDSIRKQQANNQFYDVHHTDLINQETEEEIRLEVLSEIYPENVPLVLRKPNKKQNLIRNSGFPTLEQPVSRPFALASNTECGSIGSFSPDTPQITSFEKLGALNSRDPAQGTQPMVRRSVIMDKLSQLTMSAQEAQMAYYDELDIERSLEDGASASDAGAYRHQIPQEFDEKGYAGVLGLQLPKIASQVSLKAPKSEGSSVCSVHDIDESFELGGYMDRLGADLKDLGVNESSESQDFFDNSQTRSSALTNTSSLYENIHPVFHNVLYQMEDLEQRIHSISALVDSAT